MKKANIGYSVVWFLGVIYSVLGAVFLILGGILVSLLRETDGWICGVIFSGIGGLFFLLGVVFLAIAFRDQRRADKLVAGGRYLWGQIAALEPNYNIRINGRNPYTVAVRYVDSAGTVHIFRSRNIHGFPDSALIGKQVKVYIRDDKMYPYYVDLEGVLPRVVEH